MKEVQAIIDRIQSDQLLTEAMFEVDLDAALDLRDAPPFETAWMAAYKKLPDADIPEDLKGLHQEIRKAAFLKTMQLTQSPELAGYVSDDFGLIASSLMLDVSDPWLNTLWKEYDAGNFPAGDLTPLPGSLADLIP